MSFRVKSSHQFVNPNEEQKTSVVPSYLDYSITSGTTSSKTSTSYIPKSKTNTDTEVVLGSEKGMAVRTNITAMADYY